MTFSPLTSTSSGKKPCTIRRRRAQSGRRMRALAASIVASTITMSNAVVALLKLPKPVMLVSVDMLPSSAARRAQRGRHGAAEHHRRRAIRRLDRAPLLLLREQKLHHGRAAGGGDGHELRSTVTATSNGHAE
jgi:hypothetical protein